MRPAPTESAAQTFARGLGIDPVSRARGEADARAGAAWACPDTCDLLAYSLGYAAGRAERVCCGGESAPRQPEE